MAVIVILLFHKYVVMIALFVVLGYAGIKTFEFTQAIPDMSAEAVTAFAMLMVYLYDWKIGMTFAVVFTVIGQLKISKLNLIAITLLLVTGLGVAASAFFKSLGYTFVKGFIYAFLFRGAVSYPFMQIVNPNPVKNGVHAVADTFLNIFIYIHFIKMIYDAVIFFKLA
ncbi:MAG: hypothetical protein KKF44_07105 [Nanoarchaeota archaeon]|nr:hypothetical protein [Nanoarchaeota archaeon]